MLKQQKDECVLKEKKTRQFMEAVLTAAEHVSKERDQLLQMVLLTLPLRITHAGYPWDVFCTMIGGNRSHLKHLEKEEKGKKKILNKCNVAD